MAEFASAGNAVEKSADVVNPVGLYRHPDGFYIGVLDPIQGDAVIRQGFKLIEEGRDAAMRSEQDIKASDKAAQVSAGDTTIVPEPTEPTPEPEKGSK